MPKVSVVIPSYNHERFIGEAIQSVLAQTMSDLELIVVDDASTDRSQDVIRGFSDPRVHCIAQTENRGVSAAINRGIGIASSPYVAVMGSDDVFLPEKLATQVAMLEGRPEVAVVFSHVHVIDDQSRTHPQHGETLARHFAVENRGRLQWLAHLFQSGNFFCHSSSLMRKSCFDHVGLYDERLLQLQDFDMWIRVLLHWEIVVCDQRLVKYRWQQGGGNLSAPDLGRMSRLRWETPHVLGAFLKLTFSDLQEMFGTDHVAPYLARGVPPELVIIDMALGSGSPEYQLFGLNSLFHLLPASGASGNLYPYLSAKALELDPVRFKAFALCQQKVALGQR